MFETSQTTAKLDAALAKAQGKIEAASKDKVNPAFRSKYADLPAVWAAIRPALAEAQISVTQWPIHSDDGRLHMITRIAHDGEWIKAEFSIPVSKQDAHGFGSATTYAKRFSLAAAVGVVADDDDDGNAASNKSSPPAPPKVVPQDNSTGLGLTGGTPGASKAASRDAYDKLVKAIRDASSLKALEEWRKTYGPEIDKLPADWLDEMRIEFVDRQAELKRGLAA